MWKALACVLLLILGLGTLLWAEPAKKQDSSSPSKPALSPAAQNAPAKTMSTLPTPLPADLFKGRVRDAYKAAAEIPDVLAGLACYCGCNKSHGHRHLLDCFVDDHGAG
jgi:hypothetical protein